MKEKYLLALDQGTSSSRSVLFSLSGEAVSQVSVPIGCRYPRSGWVEQDAEDIWRTQAETMEKVLSGFGLAASDLVGVGITNQRESVIAWDGASGKAISPAINWQCRRTTDFCETLKKSSRAESIREKTGLVIDPYFSASKMRWILEHVAEAETLAKEGRLMLGTVDTWLVYRLTGGKIHRTDFTNASRTMLFNIAEGKWDDELLDVFGIPASTLPEVVPSCGKVGLTEASRWGSEVPIVGIAGDQQAATFGQACFEEGMAKNTYGTGCFILMNTGSRIPLSAKGLLTTVAWHVDGKTTYALEGSVYIAGALVQWLRDEMGFFEDASETEAMARSVPDSNGVYVVPAFVGLGAPQWDSHARGSIMGLTRSANKNHVVRAALEAICFQSHDVLELMEQESGFPLKQLKVDGGASMNGLICQFQADLINKNVIRPRIAETTALGAALLAGLATGVWNSPEALAETWKADETYRPQDSEQARSMLAGWKEALKRSMGWTSSF